MLSAETLPELNERLDALQAQVAAKLEEKVCVHSVGGGPTSCVGL